MDAKQQAKAIRRGARVMLLAAANRKGGAHTSPKGAKGYNRKAAKRAARKEQW